MKIMLTACLSLSLGAASDAPRTRFISHRGESMNAPENTMAAFRAAVERGADGFELDVYLTKDDGLICLHDSTTKRTTGVDLKPRAATLAELRALDAGAWKGPQFTGERLPTLAEALALAHDGFEIYVEIKCGTEILPSLAGAVAAEPKATPERVVFICFDAQVIAALRQQFPAYRAYWLTGTGSTAAALVAAANACNASGVHAQDSGAINAAFVNAVKAAGLSFHTWTVDNVSRARELAAMGVDTVTSNCGAALKRALYGEPPDGRPVIRWTFDGTAENSGTGGARYDAVLAGAPEYADGVLGRGLRLDGVDDAARVPYQLPEQGTVALWFKPDRFYNYNTVFDNDVNPDQWEMWIYGDGRLKFRIASGTGEGVCDLNGLGGAGKWYHLAVVWDCVDANQVKLYVDGVERAAGAATRWVAPGGTFQVGGGNPGNTPAEGVVDDVRVYDAPLTAAQVQALHAEVAAQAPVVHVTFDGTVTNCGTGGTRYDAVLHGAPAYTNGVGGNGQALALDGVDDSVAVPYRLPTSGTIALWYYAPGPWYDYNSVFDNALSANDYECWIDKLGVVNFRLAYATWPQNTRYSLGSGSNRWHHITGTWDALSGSTVLYVNGAERGRGVSTAAWPAAGATFFLGGGQTANMHSRGIVSDLQIFDTPLPPDRVAEVYGGPVRRGGLVAYLPFDGAAEDVAGSNAVVVTGSPVFVKGPIGKALSYEPAVTPGVGGSRVSVSNVLGSTGGTIALWFYARGPWYDYHPVIDNAVHTERWESWIYGDGRFAIRVSNLTGGGSTLYDLDNLRGPDNWYHIAFTWDRAAQQTRLYIDGVQRTTATLSDAGWVDPDPTLHIGSFHAANKAANGIWDEVRVYERPLTTAEIKALTVIPPPPPSRRTLMLVQ